MAAVSVLRGWLRPSVQRGVLNFLMLKSSYTDSRSRGDFRLVTKSLNYLRKDEKYAATTSRAHADFSMEDSGAEATLVQKLTELTSSGPDQRSIRSLNKTEVLLLLRLLATGRFPGTWPPALTQQLDTECARRVAMWEAGTCLLALDLWLAWLGQGPALRLGFYRVLLREWHLMPGSDKPGHVTQLLFYVGLAKQAPEPLMRRAEGWLEGSLASLAQEDLAIVCQSFFKTSTKMASGRLLAAVAAQARAVVDAGTADTVHLVSFLKVLRHARHEDPELCARLAGFLKTSLGPQDTALVDCAHYAAFFANVRHYDRELFCRFEACTLGGFEAELAFLARTDPAEARNLHPSLLSRMKDIARILWAMSEAGHQPVRKDFWQAAVGYLRRRMRVDRDYLQPRPFVDCLHSLALAGVYPEDLLDLVPRVDPGTLQDSRTARRQLHVLHESLRIERSAISPGLRTFTLVRDEGPGHRCPNLDVVHDVARQGCDGDGDLCRRHCLLGHVPIEGLEFLLDKDGKLCNLHKSSNYKNCMKVALEVVESTKCTESDCRLTGLHTMKIRQLRKLGFKVVTIFPQDIRQLEGKSPQEKTAWLKALLRRTINERYPFANGRIK